MKFDLRLRTAPPLPPGRALEQRHRCFVTPLGQRLMGRREVDGRVTEKGSA